MSRDISKDRFHRRTSCDVGEFAGVIWLVWRVALAARISVAIGVSADSS
jgi:hypothetical protein